MNISTLACSSLSSGSGSGCCVLVRNRYKTATIFSYSNGSDTIIPPVQYHYHYCCCCCCCHYHNCYRLPATPSIIHHPTATGSRICRYGQKEREIDTPQPQCMLSLTVLRTSYSIRTIACGTGDGTWQILFFSFILIFSLWWLDTVG